METRIIKDVRYYFMNSGIKYHYSIISREITDGIFNAIVNRNDENLPLENRSFDAKSETELNIIVDKAMENHAKRFNLTLHNKVTVS